MKINNKIFRLKRFVNSIVIASEARQSRRMTRLKAGKPISLLLALTIILSLFLVAVPMAGIAEATYYYVREDGDDDDSHNGLVDDADHAWLTIQYAINTVSSGNTINVAAGEYNEGSLVFNKNDITLIGSGVDTTTIITSSNKYGVSVPSGVDDIKIIDLTIKEDTTYDADTCSGTSSERSERFHLKISHNSGFTLRDVNLEGPGKDNSCIVGLDLNSVQDVTVCDVHISGYSTNGVGVIASSDLLFHDITIDDNGYTGSTGWAGISFYTMGSGDITNVQFEGTNTISNNPMGIYVENIGGDVFITSGSAALSDNLIPLVAFNYLEDFPISIVDAYAENVFGVPVRLDNAFEDPPNSFLVGYWHNVASAGTAATRSEADGKPTIFNLVDDEWYVVDGMSIQDAIDAASESAGDTINVAAGEYSEDGLVADIYKSNLTLQSIDGPAVTIIKSKGEEGDGAVRIRGADDETTTTGVTVDGFTVYNTGTANSGAGIFIGAWFAGDMVHPASDNTVKNCIIGSATDQSLSPTNGVYLWNTTGNLIQSNIIYKARNEPDNFGCGIMAWGGLVGQAAPSPNTQIIDNQIYDSDRFGVFIGAATQQNFDNMIVRGNTITGSSGAPGIGLWNILGCDTIHINKNDIYNNGVGGVGVSDCDATVDATNNWWGDASGPYHPTNNPGGSGNKVSDNVKFIPFLASSSPGGEVVNNVSITKSGPTSANSGDDITYKIIYKNIGTDYATNVVITETYPSEVKYRSATPPPDEGNNIWNISDLAPGEGGTITVTVYIK